ncbi:MAG TPA: CcmD family protein [Longimicrobium sp.]|jgi:CcmD family protein
MRILRPTRFALAAAALLAFAPAPVRMLAQETSTTSAPAGETAPGAPLTAAPEQAAATSSGLPASVTAARTLRAHWHVYTAFTIAWLLVFGYVISLARRFGRLENELNARGAS